MHANTGEKYVLKNESNLYPLFSGQLYMFFCVCVSSKLTVDTIFNSMYVSIPQCSLHLNNRHLPYLMDTLMSVILPPLPIPKRLPLVTT